MNNLDKDETEENGSVDKICNKFIEIASRPEVQPNPDSAKFFNKQCERVWLVAASCEDDCNDWRALPAWIGKTIEREICVWRKIDHLEDQERQLITEALESVRWNKSAAAKKLGISFRALRYKLKKLDLELVILNLKEWGE